MNTDQPITREYFIKHLVNLCLRSGLSGFPKDDVNQHILLKSVVLSIGKSGAFTEQEINEELKYWINHIGQIKDIDHITLRRRLVDAGYLTRNKDGSCYQVSQLEPGPPFFDETIEHIEILEVIETAREEIARRKRKYVTQEKTK